MKIIYTPNISQWKRPPNLPYESYISLSQNEWDDFGNKTSLNIKVVVEGREIEVNSVLKIKIEDVDSTYSFLNKLIKDGWNGEFPIPNKKYITLANNILFYQGLKSKLEVAEIKDILKKLNDLIFLENFVPESENLTLKNDESFYSSLLRESGEKLAYKEGYNAILEKDFSIQDFEYDFIDRSEKVKKIKFNFNSDNLPYDVNVLIGSNGVGKSFLIKQLLIEMLSLNLKNKFDEKKDILTSFNRVLLISYSLFEDFDVDLKRYKKIQDKNIYKYFGFRRRKANDVIGVSRNTPTFDSATSLVKCICDDYEFNYIVDWDSKFLTIFEVLNKAFKFDEIFLHSKDEEGKLISHKLLMRFQHDEEKLTSLIDFTKGIIFKLEGSEVNLSSGQRFFTFMVINILAYIKKNTIIFIDEPELFLHPLLEIELITLLKDILIKFQSKSIIATHSLTIVREIPSKCVHVMKYRDNELFINKPPFETFGGDMQRISSYVFGDNSVTKPFEEWLSKKMEDQSPRDLIESLNGELNEEMIVKILNFGNNNV